VVNFKIRDLSKKNVKLVRPTLANYIAQREEFVERSQQLLELVAVGALKVGFGGEYSLQELSCAQDDLAGKNTTGKLIVKIESR
jgi:NADPH:quinone reductase